MIEHHCGACERGEPLPCYTCGRDVMRQQHRESCPDHPTNRERMPWLTQQEFDRLIPVGTYTHRGVRV